MNLFNRILIIDLCFKILKLTFFAISPLPSRVAHTGEIVDQINTLSMWATWQHCTLISHICKILNKLSTVFLCIIISLSQHHIIEEAGKETQLTKKLRMNSLRNI